MTIVKLIGPNRRRIVELNLESKRDAVTHRNLNEAGWKHYTGPGTADEHGWYQGDDPQVPVGPPAERRKV